MERVLKIRTKIFCLNCIHLAENLPNTYPGNQIQGQLIQSSSSVAANYGAAQLAQSKPAFVSKLSIVIEEADESQFWLEMISDCSLMNTSERGLLEKEASALTAIFIASCKKLSKRDFN